MGVRAQPRLPTAHAGRLLNATAHSPRSPARRSNFELQDVLAVRLGATTLRALQPLQVRPEQRPAYIPGEPQGEQGESEVAPEQLPRTVCAVALAALLLAEIQKRNLTCMPNSDVPMRALLHLLGYVTGEAHALRREGGGGSAAALRCVSATGG